MPGIVDVAGAWDGAFVGVFTGYASGELTGDSTADVSGWLLGVAAGYNFYLTDGLVAGVVGDIAWNDIGDGGSFTSGWNGSLRGRLGFDAGALMPYLTAGLAFTHGDGGLTQNVHLGWTVGAGVEFAVADNMSLDLQYRYSDYAAENYSGSETGAYTHAVTVGLNFGF